MLIVHSRSPGEAARAGERGSAAKGLILAVVLIAVAVLAVAYLILSRGGGERPTAVREGDRAPAFTLPMMDQRPMSLDDQRGKVVLVHFWATWCPPCVEEMPQLQKLYEQLAGPAFEVLAVSVDDSAGMLQSFLKKQGISLPVLFDPGRDIASRYGTRKFPETYVLDRRGTVRYKVIGPMDWTQPDALATLRRLIAEK